jgi:CDP-diacylglycerol--glycerol-3-phosphate 3-phosphatidyltransferase
MKQFINKAKASEPTLFAYQGADHVHPHDRFLAWTVLRWLPAWVTPNVLTVIRVLLTPFVIWMLSAHDALDGSLARTQNKITNFGILADPLADKLLVGSAVILLVFQNFNVWLGITILGLEILFMLSAIVLKVKFRTVRMANLWGKVKMISQVVAVSLTMLALLLDFPFLLTIASGIFGLAIGFALLSLFTHGV